MMEQRPKPDLVSVCTSPEFVSPVVAQELLKVLSRFIKMNNSFVQHYFSIQLIISFRDRSKYTYPDEAALSVAIEKMGLQDEWFIILNHYGERA